ncbi:MAG: hypothetical protein HDS60_07120 [Barnesiella sp.]|nr:hypothetical protein [Barnesiella sp.]
MKRILSLVIFIMMLVSLIGCTTSKTTLSNNINLSKYKYASVINNETYYIPAELMEYEIQLFDAVESSRLQLVSDLRIYDLSHEQQSQLLLVKYGVQQNNDEAIVTVNFIDYMSGRPVASCRGAYGLGFDRAGDLKGAIKRVTKQISETFNK